MEEDLDQQVLNIVGNSENINARLCSNTALTPFSFVWLDWKDPAGHSLIETFQSVEGPLQALRTPPGFPINDVVRHDIAAMYGKKAQDLSPHGQRTNVFLMPFCMKEMGHTWYEYVHTPVEYRPLRCGFGNQAHRDFLILLLWAKFLGNARAQKALIATAGFKLVHNTGEEERKGTSLTAVDFCRSLETIRAHLLSPFPVAQPLVQGELF